MPVMDEGQVREQLADMRAPYRVPADWWGAGDEVVAFTDDRALAVLVADVIARHDLGGSYPSVAGGGMVVTGPYAVVLVGVPGTEFVDWRSAQPADDYALLMCLVQPARMHRRLDDVAELVAEELAERLDSEAADEAAGTLAASARRTCGSCRAWATAVHMASAGHLRPRQLVGTVASAGRS